MLQKQFLLNPSWNCDINTVSHKNIQIVNIEFFMNILYVLYKSLKNFVDIVMKHDDCKYNSRIWNQSRNAYRSCKAFIVNIHLIKN